MSANLSPNPEVNEQSLKTIEPGVIDSGEPWPKPVLSTATQLNQETAKSNTTTPARRMKKDTMAVERSNLLSVCKMLIKDLIDSSLKKGRMIDDNHEPFQQFFIVIEHILMHGIKTKKGLLWDKKDYWGVLSMLEKHVYDAVDITLSVREMPNLKSSMARSRAWLRLAMMQKRLADYFRVLVDQKESLAEHYSAGSFMREEEASILSGLLVGLNVIDCSFNVKDEDLDKPLGIIDYSVFLKDAFLTQEEKEEVSSTEMDAILDQKNYLEELNRHLTSSVNNLQRKIEALSTENTLLKEDLAISKNNVVELQRENSEISNTKEEILVQHSKQMEATKEDIEVERETYQSSRQGLDSLCQDLQMKLKVFILLYIVYS